MRYTGKLVWIAMLCLIAVPPVSADIITARPEAEPTRDEANLIQTLAQIDPDSIAAVKTGRLTSEEIRYLSGRPEAVQIAGQQTDTLELMGGMFWIIATAAGTALYMYNNGR